MQKINQYSKKTKISSKLDVYKLECSYYNAVYIEQTQRNYKARYKDHLCAFKD